MECVVIMEWKKISLSFAGVLFVLASLASGFPVHGGWSAWRDATSCSSTCGFSTRNQTRTCDNPAPTRRGKNCIGPSSKTIRCRGLASCPRDDGVRSVHGGWSAWRDATSCSSTCGYSTRNQIRTCNNPAPARRGRNCIGRSSKMIRCWGLPSCPRKDEIYEAGPSLSSLVPHLGQTPSAESPFSSVDSSFESHVRPIEVIQTTEKAPEESLFSSVDSSFESHVRPIEVIQTTATAPEESPFSSVDSSFESHVRPIEVIHTTATAPEESPFSSVDSSFESHVRPIEVIHTTATAPEESLFSSVDSVSMFEVPARLIEIIQTPTEVENHSGFGSAGGNGNIMYENVPYIIRKRLIQVNSSGGNARISTA